MSENRGQQLESFSRDFYNAVHPERYIDKISLRKIGRELSDKNSLEFTGSGAECVVVKNGNNERYVTAFAYRDFDEARASEVFYVQRILSTIFPFNFPHFRLSFPTNDKLKTQGGTERRMIEDKSEHSKYKFGNKENLLNSIGIPVYLDETDVNFVTGSDGGEYYMDTPIIESSGWNKKKIVNYMKKNPRQDGKQFTSLEIRTVIKSIDRLQKLGLISVKETRSQS